MKPQTPWKWAVCVLHSTSIDELLDALNRGGGAAGRR
jgi:hypothetical protein